MAVTQLKQLIRTRRPAVDGGRRWQTVAPMLLLIALVGGAAPAYANQPKGGPYAPVSADGGQTVQAWAEMVGDCPSPADRCDTYFKVERLVSSSLFFGDDWEDVAGGWISRRSGWVNVEGTLPTGCHTYRARVLDYLRVPAGDGSIEVGYRGVVGATIPVDGGMEYKELIYPSDQVTLCGERLANDPRY